MGSACTSITGNKCQVILTNALGGTAHYSLSYQKLTADEITTNLKAGGNIGVKQTGIEVGLSGEVNQQTKKTSQKIKAKGHITNGNRATVKLMEHQMALLTLYIQNAQTCSSVVENKQVTASNQAFCIWKPYTQSQANIFQTWRSDPWRFLPQIAEDLGRNYPIGKLCVGCRQSLGCKQSCPKYQKLKGLTDIQIQNYFIGSQQNKKQTPNNKIQNGKVKFSTFSPAQSTSISVVNSQALYTITNAIQQNKEKQIVYSFQIDFNQNHLKYSPFNFIKNKIIKNKNKVPNWTGAAVVAAQPFPQTGWHQVKLWVNAPKGDITFGLVNSKFKQTLRCGQVLQYCPKISYKDQRQGIFIDDWILGSNHNLGQMMTLAMRVNIGQRKANLVVFNNIKLQNEGNNKGSQNQSQLRIIDIPDFILGQNNKVFPYVAIVSQNDTIMFL